VLLWLVVLGVLGVQTLSLVHGIAHFGRSTANVAERQRPVAEVSAHRDALRPSASPLPGSWLEALFGGHAGHDCKAFDQASHADVVVGVPANLDVAPPTSPVTAVHIAWHLAAQARGFLARGPPVVA
jgi:hypothetical protein